MPAVAAQPSFPPEAPRRRASEPVRVFLGWDLGESLGYGVVDDHGRHVRSGRFDCSRIGREHKGARFVRASRAVSGLYAELSDPARGFRLGGVGYEKVVAHSAYLAAQMYGSWKAILLGASFQAGVEPDEILVSLIKQVATGKGGGPLADKSHMVAAAKARWPGFDSDAKGADDAADAMWTADIMRRRVLGVRF